ncbi:adenylate/guanylate cyclase domain-containing protein [Mesorhizobium kowhaii]|uniref:adenylate/guanylate cyclase domain-containing protein n=1 Tax=Mesorhizobium kowhaii TaxID=1300272 RepID=UPI0035ED88B4
MSPVCYFCRCHSQNGFSNAAAAYLLLALMFAIVVLLALLSGRDSGAHFFLISAGPVLPLLLGTRRPILVAALTFVAISTFLVLEFTLPTLVFPGRPWLPQIRNPFSESLDIGFDDSVFILSMFALEAILACTTFVAFRLAESAEASLQREYARSELLLQNLLPNPIATRLRERPDSVIADKFDSVTVLFADVVGFTSSAARKRPEELVAFLERIFGEFDLLAEKHGLEKIKTIGDAYMVAGGMPIPAEGHTNSVANMALDMIKVAGRLTVEFGEEVAVRIGFHSGPAVAGVIGRRKPFYDVWGDTINVAARMESSGVPGRIQITPEVKRVLGASYTFEERGTVNVKGKGQMPLFFLTGRSTNDPGVGGVR